MSSIDAHERFVESLAREEEHLIIVRDFLYGGTWDELARDLRARQDGKPFVFKLNSRIEEDLQRIQKLSDYERQHGVDLGVYLLRSGRFPPELVDVLRAASDESDRGSGEPATGPTASSGRGRPAPTRG